MPYWILENNTRTIVKASGSNAWRLFCFDFQKITDIKNEPLSFVSIYLNGTVTGTTSNDNGNYVLEINKKGTYSIVFQNIGYFESNKFENITKKYTLTNNNANVYNRLINDKIIL